MAISAIPAQANAEAALSDPIVALWAERNRLDAEIAAIWATKPDHDNPAREQADRRRDLEWQICQLVPTTMDGMAIQATILALSVIQGERADDGDTDIARRLFARYCPANLKDIENRERNWAWLGAEREEPELPDPDDHIMSLWSVREPMLTGFRNPDLSGETGTPLHEAIQDIEARIAELEPSEPLHGMRGWGVQAAIMAAAVVGSKIGRNNRTAARIARRFLRDWDREGAAYVFAGTANAGAQLDPDLAERGRIRAEREAARQARIARVNARVQQS